MLQVVLQLLRAEFVLEDGLGRRVGEFQLLSSRRQEGMRCWGGGCVVDEDFGQAGDFPGRIELGDVIEKRHLALRGGAGVGTGVGRRRRR